MSEKKRTIVTTIETHELWIIRKAIPEPAAPILLPTEKPQLPAASTLPERNNSSETNEEEGP